MNATEHFRFVERRANGGQLVRVLQQWWETEKMINPAPGEWRDVPLLPETNDPPEKI